MDNPSSVYINKMQDSAKSFLIRDLLGDLISANNNNNSSDLKPSSVARENSGNLIQVIVSFNYRKSCFGYV